jgi:hypothetical protein
VQVFSGHIENILNKKYIYSISNTFLTTFYKKKLYPVLLSELSKHRKQISELNNF